MRNPKTTERQRAKVYTQVLGQDKSEIAITKAFHALAIAIPFPFSRTRFPCLCVFDSW